MVNRDRMVGEFIELVQIDSLSRQERQMADALKSKLEAMGYAVYEDDAASKIDGNSGNLICTIKGSKQVPAILLMSHMDTVFPGIGRKPVVDGDIIKSDGTTVLGGDDGAGIACILEVVKILKENNIPHGDIQIAFTVAEEGGLFGAKNLDYGKIYAKYAFVLDAGGDVGGVTSSAPAQNKIEAVVKGKLAHAGLEPEKGISAIQIAAEAITRMTLGRIDEETTANIGVINGGKETNVVCDRVDLKGEARSRNPQKLEKQTNHMIECLKQAAEKFGGEVDINSYLLYPSYNIKEDEKIISILRRAAGDIGVELVLEASGGASDTNIVNGKGIQAVDISIGMDKVHTVHEQIKISDMVKAAEFVLAIINNVE